MFGLFFRFAAVATASLLCASPSARASAFDAQPKLVVILVLDQFRGDYLDRFRADFKTPNGFQLFLDRGAYFPNTYYDYANTETAPGHSTIGTCAYSNGHNIANNQWWDLSRSRTRQISSVEDANFPLVGTATDAALGASPHNELASTLGDEVVLSTGGQSRLFGVSLKDRAAILTSGHASNGAFWIDHDSGLWISSTYWGPQLPGWVTAFNNGPEREDARRAAGIPHGSFYEKVGATPAAVRYQMHFAEALIQAEALGRHDTTDVLTISISSTDILGHQAGPDAPEQRRLIDATDVELNSFFNWLDTTVDGGLGSVWVALTGDHGVAPSPSVAAAEGMPAASFSQEALIAELNRKVNEHYKTAAPVRFVLGGTLPFVQLDEAAFAAASVKEADAEELVAQLLPTAMTATQGAVLQNDGRRGTLQPATVRAAYPKVQLAAGNVPNTELGGLLLHSYTTNEGWWVFLTPGMYQMAGHEKGGTNHFTPYSYDRHVPMAFFGKPFIPGTYLNQAAPVDISATFAALLRVNRPSACVGRVIIEALRPQHAAESRPGEAN